ncbi:FixH family protein [Salinicoccus sesuvii]|uniref:FixH family protein n=1 Tax=Salinicoccus sesuvii TaxID=868281 RepID=A0ABV7N573_9STAP
MKKILALIFSTSLLSACNLVGVQTHDMYNNLPDAAVSVDMTSLTEKESDLPVDVYVYLDEVPVSDADVSIRIWNIRESDETASSTDLTYSEDGRYTADVNIAEDGLYLLETNVTHPNLDAHPVHYFTLGEIDMFESMLLEDLVDDDEIDIPGHH